MQALIINSDKELKIIKDLINDEKDRIKDKIDNIIEIGSTNLKDLTDEYYTDLVGLSNLSDHGFDTIVCICPDCKSVILAYEYTKELPSCPYCGDECENIYDYISGRRGC